MMYSAGMAFHDSECTTETQQVRKHGKQKMTIHQLSVPFVVNMATPVALHGTVSDTSKLLSEKKAMKEKGPP